jgi:hypothetical protein
MNTFLTFAGAILSAACVSAASSPPDLEKLKVLYVGEPPGSARARQYTEFLQPKVGNIEAVSRKNFQAQAADEHDVVLLDWPQTGQQNWKQPAPLGERSAWAKPTVLLGSAGLNLAVVWKVRGGSG